MSLSIAKVVCLRCHRSLKDPVSRTRGLGPVCARRLKRMENEGGDIFSDSLSRAPFAGDTIRVFPLADGTMGANVSRSVVHHSPTGWQCGYAGSGPADLALNILNAFIPPGSDGEPTIACRTGVASATAWWLHHRFKDKFIAHLDYEGGGEIPASQIVEWIAQQQSEES